MTAMTSEELGITSPAEKAAAARRRDATKRVRWVRDRLTSTSGTPAFDYELLRQFAQNRQSASLAILLLVAVTSSAALSDKELASIGQRVWQNECGGTRDGLTSWNAGENFAQAPSPVHMSETSRSRPLAA